MESEKGITPDNNTNKYPELKKTRLYLLTLNEKTLQHYDEILKYLTGLKALNYIIVTEHIGQENKHYHIGLQFVNSRKLSLKKLFGTHVEIGNYGSIDSIIKYCRCEDEKHKKLGITSKLIFESGEPKNKKKFPTIKEVENMSIEERKELPIQYKNIIDKMELEEENEIDVEDMYKDVEVYYIQGPSGIGKTEAAKKIIRNKKNKYGTKLNMIKFIDPFYLGTSRNCPIALYDDFRDNHMKPDEFINLIDYNKHQMNIKGGKQWNNYKLIIFTSVKKLTDLYPNAPDEPRQQWLRRINVINFYTDEDEDNILDIKDI